MLTTAAATTQGYLLRPGTLPAMSTVILVLAYVWLLYTRHGRLRHVPGPWLSKVSSLHLAFHDLSYCRNDEIFKWHRLYGPVVRIAPNEVSVATLEATKEIYGATHRWAKSNYFDNFMGYNMRSVFATKPYEEHRAKRRLTSVFYQASNIYKLPEIEQHIQERSQAVLGQIRHGQEVDVYSLTDWFALDNITYLVLGPDHCTHSVERVCPERDLFMELKHLQFVGPFRVRYPKVFAPLSRLLGKLNPRLKYLLADEKLASWCQQRISTAINDPRLFSSHSLLRYLLENHEVREAMQPLDRQYIAAEVLDNINAAEATVAVTATYLIWRLTEAPQWQRRIRKELALLPVQVDGSISFSDIDSRVPSLEACLREVYRLHPASSGRAERIVPEGGHTFLGLYLPEGTIVTASVVALHRDEKIFPDSERFAPERWLETDETTLKVCEPQLIPFGYGGRICLGKALATMEIKLLIAQLYEKYETAMTASSTAESMRQCSTHDAVPKDLECVVRFQNVEEQI
ncbi:cytochrome p450 [Hirsutella rhossiliensis]|uniref:Cytochrome p450 domain-containing protein n=1 Tax=Hirsutella rhossiliensis TaxID=111463 RepID=A0A9P8MX41_9HYPO|nr:cytochrome p450 domain-containing protein [Hirsutella rhossiliensis]KAH0962860.1 cytochrome p450 domain-containing protein [Hirsutella rhossiliensis]